MDKLRIGDWLVDAVVGRLTRGEENVRLEARTLRLLLDLAEHAGEVVSIDDLLDRVWSGVTVTPDSVYQAVAALRRLLGDDPKAPVYIVTVPRLGYRLIAPVTAMPDEIPASPAKPEILRHHFLPVIAGSVFVAFSLVCGVAIYEQSVRVHATHLAKAAEPTTVGVLPFFDFSDAMDQEPLVDAVTEGLCDQLSSRATLRTPSFRSTFQLKGKHASIAQAAKILHVAYMIDGAVRKHGSEVKITARLTRANTGFVVWARAYKRPLAEIGDVQNDIADHVARLLGPQPNN